MKKTKKRSRNPVTLKSTAFNTMLRILNEAHAADPVAMSCLVNNHVPCNSALADHEYIPVFGFDGGATIGMLGIINGLCEAVTGERIAMTAMEPTERDARIRVLNFVKYVEPKTP